MSGCSLSMNNDGCYSIRHCSVCLLLVCNIIIHIKHNWKGRYNREGRREMYTNMIDMTVSGLLKDLEFWVVTSDHLHICNEESECDCFSSFTAQVLISTVSQSTWLCRRWRLAWRLTSAVWCWSLVHQKQCELRPPPWLSSMLTNQPRRL